jgi:Tol biopolymer transport system component
MTLASGTRLGSYEVVAQIGAGGMGEVYRARDTKLARDVAIKVLPANFVNDPERLSRFQREARMLAALNHANIATIYGLEQSGGVTCLVMELVPGETLAERVKAGPLAIEEALKIAVQIAEALEAAHEKSIIHRDLKPANVKVTPEGKVKVLDFGLAKAFAGDATNDDMSNSPTLSRAATMQGVILGTAAYMSPEQARGKSVDKRTDIWAFGCVLYELLTGKQTFHGEDATDILAAVVRAEPAWQALPEATPLQVRSLLRRCLQKDRSLRLRDAGDARIEIQEAISAPATAAATTATPAARGWREWAAWAAAGALALVAIAFAIGFVLRAPKPLQPVRLSAEIGVDATLYTEYGASAILSPDGTRLALVATGSDQKQRIYIRSLDQLQATVLSATENARDPFFSADGQWLGFFADGKLKKISVQGGAAVTLCDVPNDRGGSWGDDGSIVFTADNRGGLSKVSASGGTPQPLTTLDKRTSENTHRWPQVLPGSKAVLFMSAAAGGTTAGFEDGDIVVYSIASGQRKTVQRGGFYARYLPSGHVVYMHEGTLFAVPFDLKRLEVTGQPAPILEGVLTTPGYAGAQFSFSETGSIAYIAGRSVGVNVSIYWMDREGKFTPLRETPGNYTNPMFSPDGKRLALEINDGKRTDIWVYEWERDALTRLTFAGEANASPVWTPDGQRIVYSSRETGGALNLWWIRADGAEAAQRLTESKNPQYARSWRPDGKFLAFHELNPSTNFDVMTLPIEGNEKSGWKPGEPKPFVNSAFIEVEPAFSPDGRWIAYGSNESGSFEVYVRPFPGPGGKWQISTGGGPKWSRNGRELFYRTVENKIMVVTYTASGDSFRADKPQLWSPGQFTATAVANYNFDLHPDGKRFAVLKTPGTEHAAAVNKVSFIFNFFDELRSKFQPGK